MRGKKTVVTVGMGRDLSVRAHRQLIGILGLLLPIVLYVLAGLRPTEGLPSWNILGSVSAYYYTGAVGVFIGVLFALSLFLFSYRGYVDDRIDRIIGKIAGVAALWVPLFPTKPPLAALRPTWWTPMMEKLHAGSAIILFGSFILFALWLFRQSRIPRFRDRPVEKQARDMVCLLCGVAMILAVLWAAIASITGYSIFWPETVAIEAFAISWLAKGEVHLSIARAARFLTTGKRSEPNA
jgi:hypothetical protein